MNTDWHDLIQRHLAGALSDEETHTLQEALKTDGALRDLFLDHANLDCALAAIADSRTSHLQVTQKIPAAPAVLSSHRRFPWPQLAAAACLVLIAAALWWILPPRAIVEVVQVAGEVRWTHDDKALRDVQPGQKLAAGTFQAADEDALLRLRFADGTRLELCGPMIVRISEEKQKVIRVTKGALTAEVTPQPPGRPMRVLSPTAEVEVLGTVFSLEALETTARLQVAEGKVRLRRVADGDVAEVAAQQSVVASASAVEALVPAIPAAAPEEWSLAAISSEEIVQGTIKPADANDPFRMEGTAPPRFHPKLGKFTFISRVVVKSPPPQKQMLATVRDDTVIELRWRTRTRTQVECFLYTRKPQGGFGGTFSFRSNYRQPMDADGWHSVRVPLREFRPGPAPQETSAVGLEVRTIVVTCCPTPDWQDAGLEVAELRILRPSQKAE